MATFCLFILTYANDCFYAPGSGNSSSALANGTIESRALSLLDQLDGCAAHAAGFACLAVHKITLLEIAAAAVAVHEVAQCAAALLDRN